MKTILPKALFVALPLAGLLAGTPAVFAHGDDDWQHERFHQELNEEHQAAHQDLNAAHREFHQHPYTKRQHRRFHRALEREHRAVHRDLQDWHRDYHDWDGYSEWH